MNAKDENPTDPMKNNHDRGPLGRLSIDPFYPPNLCEANRTRAAPDLLAACQDWVDGWIVAKGECPGCRADVDGGEKHLDGCPMQATQAAISKAQEGV